MPTSFKKLNLKKLDTIADARKKGIGKYLGPLDHIAYRVEYGEIQDMMEWVIKNTPNDFLKFYDISDQNARTVVLRFKKMGSCYCY